MGASVSPNKPRHRSLPGPLPLPSISHPTDGGRPSNIGPWNLKRSISGESGLRQSSRLQILHEKINEPGLSGLLEKIDEHCADVERLVSLHPAKTRSHQDWDPMVDQVGDEEKRKRHQENTKVGWIWSFSFWMLLLCVALVPASTPLLSCVFARKDWRKITWVENATPGETFGFFLAFLAFAIGVIIFWALYGMVTLDRISVCRRKKDARLLALLSIGTGFAHVVWTLIWISHLASHV